MNDLKEITGLQQDICIEYFCHENNPLLSLRYCTAAFSDKLPKYVKMKEEKIVQAAAASFSEMLRLKNASPSTKV